MNALSSKISAIVFSFFPVFFLGVFVMPNSETTPIDDCKNIIQVLTDTIPIEEMVTDTIITFDPETFEETVAVVTRKKSALPLNSKQLKFKSGIPGTIDTFIVFDPVTLKETIYTLKN